MKMKLTDSVENRWDRDSSYLETRQQGDYAASVAGTEATVPRSDDAWVYKEDEYDAKRLKELAERREERSPASSPISRAERIPYRILPAAIRQADDRYDGTGHSRSRHGPPAGSSSQSRTESR